MKTYENKTLDGDHPRILVSEEFIEKNRLSLNRSQDEIVNYMKNADDWMGNIAGVLLQYLDWEHAKTCYKDEYVSKVESGEEKHNRITDVGEAVQDFLDYMVFGWMKAIDRRGLSASRTVEKLSAWAWLLGRDDIATLLNDDGLYNPYGMPALIKACEELGITVPDDCHEFAKHKCKEEPIDTSLD